MPVLAYLNQLPLEPGKTQPDPCTNQRSQPRCVSAQRLPENSAYPPLYRKEVDVCLCLPPDRTWHKVSDPKVDYNGDLGEGKVGHEPWLELCWSSAHFVHSWTWTQIWIQAHMPDYSLNWTARSSAIQGWQKVSLMLLAHSKVVQSKLRAFWSHICHGALTVRHGCQTVRWKASARSSGGSRSLVGSKSPRR